MRPRMGENRRVTLLAHVVAVGSMFAAVAGCGSSKPPTNQLAEDRPGPRTTESDNRGRPSGASAADGAAKRCPNGGLPNDEQAEAEWKDCNTPGPHAVTACGSTAMYLLGLGRMCATPDPARADRALQHPCDLDDAWACMQLAVELSPKGRFPTDLPRAGAAGARGCRLGAASGDPQAAQEMACAIEGRAIWFGYSEKPDHTRAAEKLAASCKRGGAFSCRLRGALAESGALGPEEKNTRRRTSLAPVGYTTSLPASMSRRRTEARRVRRRGATRSVEAGALVGSHMTPPEVYAPSGAFAFDDESAGASGASSGRQADGRTTFAKGTFRGGTATP